MAVIKVCVVPVQVKLVDQKMSHMSIMLSWISGGITATAQVSTSA